MAHLILVSHCGKRPKFGLPPLSASHHYWIKASDWLREITQVVVRGREWWEAKIWPLSTPNFFFFFFFFFFKSFWWTHVLFGGHWYPCFGFLVTSPLGFKARVGSALFAIFVEANVMYIPQDSPLVLHLLASWQPVCSQSLPHMHVQRWNLGSDSNVQPHEQKTNALPLCKRPGDS